MIVLLRREPFVDIFELRLENGHSEELDAEETREWFKSRGANMDVVEKAMDHCWNFYSANVRISKPVSPEIDSRIAPRL